MTEQNLKIRLAVEATISLEDVTQGWTDEEKDKLRQGDPEAREAAHLKASEFALENADHVETEMIEFP